mgnify:CR=1 FL=1
MIGYMNDLIYVCAPAPLQYGVALGINTLQDDFYQQLVTEYTWKRDRICSVLDKIGLTPAVPQGAYYVLADISRLHGLTSKEKRYIYSTGQGLRVYREEHFIMEIPVKI